MQIEEVYRPLPIPGLWIMANQIRWILANYTVQLNYYKHEDGRIVKYPTSLDEEDMSSEGIIDNMMIYPITKEYGSSLNQVNPLLHRLKARLENYSNYLLFFIIPQTTDLNNTKMLQIATIVFVSSSNYIYKRFCQLYPMSTIIAINNNNYCIIWNR